MKHIGNQNITLNDYKGLLFGNDMIELDSEALDKVRKSFEFLQEFAKNKVIYGINTCFGPMAQYKISEQHQIELQYNLIRSHSSGTGNIISPICVKSVIISRLNTLLRAYSGVNPDVVLILKQLINNNIFPVLYEHGGVGASGDLVQLAHLALTLIGEGEVFYQQKIQSTKEVFEKLNIKPIRIFMREGLALMNGTSVMTGIGIVNIIKARNLFNWTVLAVSMITEIVEAYDDHISEELNAVKLHHGQQKIARIIRNILKDSKLIKKRTEHLFNRTVTETVIKEKVQEYYSIRCVPQIMGPIIEVINNCEKVLIEEVNSVNDNPIVDYEVENVFHGGNFHGDYVSFEMDKLKIAMTKLSMLIERQINYLMNNKLNDILPPFVNLGTLGLNLGMQGVQFTATSTVAENQTLSFPMYIHSIPNNNDNQDIVSMGTNSALIAGKVIENTSEVLAIHFMSIIQAIDYLKIQNKQSSKTQKIYQELREIMPVFVNDTIKYPDIKNIKNHISTTFVDIEN